MLLTIIPRAQKVFVQQRCTGNAICPTRRTFFRRLLFFFPLPLPLLLYLFFTKASHAVDRILRASTCKNFISLAYIRHYIYARLLHFSEAYALFF